MTILILTILTFFIVAFQAYITYRQLQLMEKQDKLLARYSNLKLICEYNQSKYQFEFTAQNIGHKGAADFYWDIYVPISLSERNMRLEPTNEIMTPIDTKTIEGKSYKRFSGSRADKLYPGRAKFLCNFPLPSSEMKGTFKFYWQLINEDGVFPSKQKYGSSKLTV